MASSPLRRLRRLLCVARGHRYGRPERGPTIDWSYSNGVIERTVNTSRTCRRCGRVNIEQTTTVQP